MYNLMMSGWLGTGVAERARSGNAAVTMARPRHGLLVAFGDVRTAPRPEVQQLA